MTSPIFAPDFSQTAANSLTKESFTARKAFEPCLIVSADSQLQVNFGQSIGSKMEITDSATSGDLAPITILLGERKSRIA